MRCNDMSKYAKQWIAILTTIYYLLPNQTPRHHHPPSPLHVHCTPTRDKIRRRAKIGRPAQCCKYIAHVIRGIDSFLKGTVPPCHNSLDDLYTCEIDILDTWRKASLINVEEVVDIGYAWWGTIKIAACAHHDDAREVSEVLGGRAKERFKTGVVFLRSGAVDAAAIGEEFGCVFEGFGEEGAAVVYV